MSNHFTRGLNFSDTAPGNSVTADRLHQLVEGATLTTAAITEQTEVTSLESSDYLLGYDASGNVVAKFPYSSLTSSPVGIAGFRNLVVKNNSGSPATTVDVTIDEILLRSSTGVLIRAATVSESANITVSGAGGLDTGAEATATWYYLWIISNGSDVAAMLSTSATAPTMPSGYDYKTRIGGVYNEAGGDFWNFVQNDTEYSPEYQAGTLSATTFTANTDPSATTNYTAIVLDGSAPKPFIPATACRLYGYIGRTDAANLNVAVAASTSGIGAVVLRAMDTATAMGSFLTALPFEVPIITTQTIYAKAGATVTNTMRIGVSGFRIKP